MGTAPLSPSRLRGLLRHPEIGGAGVRRLEDQYDDVYTAEVPFHGGPRLVMQGLTSRSAHTARLLLEAIYGPEGAGLPEEYRREASGLTLGLLDLSDLVCRRAGLDLHVVPPDVRGREVFVPGRARLDLLKQAVTFTPEEAIALFGEHKAQFERLLIHAEGRKLNFADGTDDALVVAPLRWTTDGFVVASPSELVASLRHHLIHMAMRNGCVHTLATAFARAAANRTKEILVLLLGAGMDGDWSVHDSGVMTARFRNDAGLTIDVALLTDDLREYAEHMPFGIWPNHDLGDRLNESLLNMPKVEVGPWLRLAITDGVARQTFLGFGTCQPS